MSAKRSLLLTIALIAIAFLPAVMLRDLNPLNELNYLSIADDALKRGSFFAFYMDGAPYADKPPLYLWLCMLNVFLFGANPALLLSAGSLLPFLIIIYVTAKELLPEVRVSAPILAICLTAPLFMSTLALLGRMDMLFTMFICLSYTLMMRRTAEVLETGSSKRYEISIPLLLFLGLFTKGPYALIFPLAALLIFLACRKKLRLYFKILRPKHLMIILVCVLAWAGCVLLDGGISYAENLFIGQSSKRLSGSMGHPEPIFWYLLNIWYLAAPLSLSFLSFVIADIKSKGTRLSMLRLAALSMTAAVLLVISIPSSKLEIYLLPAIPYLAAYVLLSFKEYEQNRLLMRLNRIFLGVQAVLLVFLFIGHFFFRHAHPLASSWILSAAILCLAAGGLLAVYKLVKSDLTHALAGIGCGSLGFIFMAGLAMPAANPYLGMGTLAAEAAAGMERGAPKTVCIAGYRNADNLYLYDPRLEVIETEDIYEKRCQNAQIIAGRRYLRGNDHIREDLLSRGGKAVGDGIYLESLNKHQ